MIVEAYSSSVLSSNKMPVDLIVEGMLMTVSMSLAFVMVVMISSVFEISGERVGACREVQHDLVLSVMVVI